GLHGMLALAEDVDIVGEASSGAAAVEVTARLQPDLVLMDLRMPGELDGVAATAAITARLPPTRVFVPPPYDTDADILRAVEAGAAGYLLKDARRDDLVAAVRAAARGETVLAPAVAARLGRRAPAAAGDAP